MARQDNAAPGTSGNNGAPTKPSGFVGRGGATERADFGRKATEGAERSLQRRVQKSTGKYRRDSDRPRPSERLRQDGEQAPPIPSVAGETIPCKHISRAAVYDAKNAS